MAELQEFFYTINCHTGTIQTSTSQQWWKKSCFIQFPKTILRSQGSTQPKGPPLAHSKWHAIENPKSEWCKPQRHPKSARSLHLTDCPWCLHAFATSCHYPTVGSPGGIFMHFCYARDACDIEESPQQSLSVSSIITPLSRGGGKCSLNYSSAVAWDLDFLKKTIPVRIYNLI